MYVLCKKDPKHKQVRGNVDCFMIALTCRDKDRPLITTCMFIRFIESLYAASQVSLTDAHIHSFHRSFQITTCFVTLLA